MSRRLRGLIEFCPVICIGRLSIAGIPIPHYLILHCFRPRAIFPDSLVSVASAVCQSVLHNESCPLPSHSPVRCPSHSSVCWMLHICWHASPVGCCIYADIPPLFVGCCIYADMPALGCCIYADTPALFLGCCINADTPSLFVECYIYADTPALACCIYADTSAQFVVCYIHADTPALASPWMLHLCWHASLVCFNAIYCCISYAGQNFGRFTLWISAGTPTVPRFSWLFLSLST
jgi:hypothetical protein